MYALETNEPVEFPSWLFSRVSPCSHTGWAETSDVQATTLSPPLLSSLGALYLQELVFPSIRLVSHKILFRKERKHPNSPLDQHSLGFFEMAFFIRHSFVSFLYFQHEVSESLLCVKLKILSNWGHPKYTCLYRFRVHGTPGEYP